MPEVTTLDPLGEAYAAYDTREREYKEQHPEVDRLDTMEMLYVFKLEEDIAGLVTAIVHLLDAYEQLPVRSNTPRRLWAPVHAARDEATVALRKRVGGKDFYNTMYNAHNQVRKWFEESQPEVQHE